MRCGNITLELGRRQGENIATIEARMIPVDIGSAVRGIKRSDVLLGCGAVLTGAPVATAICRRMHFPMSHDWFWVSSFLAGSFSVGVSIIFLSAMAAGILVGLHNMKQPINVTTAPWNHMPFRITAREFIALPGLPELIAAHDENAYLSALKEAEKNRDPNTIDLLQREKVKRLTNDLQWSEWYWTVKNFVLNEDRTTRDSSAQLQYVIFTSLGWSGLLSLIVEPAFRHWSLWVLATLLVLCGMLAVWGVARSTVPEFDNILTAEMLNHILDRKRPNEQKQEKESLLKKLGISN